MNTTQLTCFLTVAETLNFAKAAQQLHVTQPAVTQQIHALEEELSFRLFHRTTRTVTLTHEGLLFLADAKNVLDILERAKKRGADNSPDKRMEFTIGCHAHDEIYPFCDVLKRMRVQFPGLYPVFRVVPFRHLYQQLTEERMDVIISFRESDLKKHAVYKELTKIQLLAAIPVTHPLAGRDNVCLEDLKRETIVITEPWKYPDILQKIQHQLVEDKPVSDIFLCDSAAALTTLICAGYGVGIIPDLICVQNSALRYLPVADIEKLSYGAYYKKTASTALCRAFLATAKEVFDRQSNETTTA